MDLTVTEIWFQVRQTQTDEVDATPTLVVDTEPKCLPRALPKDTAGDVACKFIEASQPSGECTCDAGDSLRPAEPAAALATRRHLRETGQCGGVNQPSCEEMCLCEYLAATPDADGRALDPADVRACLNGDNIVSTPTWCYVDDPASPVVAHCDPSQRQILRLLGAHGTALPRNGSILSIGCIGTRS